MFTRKFLVAATLMVLPLVLNGAESENRGTAKAYRVVFEVTADTPEKWLGALRNVENAMKSVEPKNAQFEVVAHGKGLGILVARNAAEQPDLKAKLDKLHADGVVFAACENTMRREKVEKKDLLEEATTVDSGVGEVIRKQAEGYHYIKIGG